MPSEAISDDQVKNVGESEEPVHGCVDSEGRAEMQNVEERGEQTDFPLQTLPGEGALISSSHDVMLDDDDELMEEVSNEADDEMDQGASRVPIVNFDDAYAADPCRYFLDKDASEMDKLYMECLEFNSCDDAFKFYRTYGHIIGFSVRKGSSRRDKKTNELLMKEFSCNKAGWRMDKWNKLENRKKEPRALTRTGCVAHIRVKLNKRTGKWAVSWFEGQHNHELAKPKQRHLLRSNRQVPEGSLQFARALRRTGARPCQIMSYLAQEAGGFQSVGFTRKDLKNRLYTLGRNSVEAGNIHTAITYLETKANSDPGFYVSYAVDKDNTFQRAFWSDSISRADYSFFSDVIAFDTTYRKNGMNLPLLVFVGVNHHHQTIIFGFALLTVENEEAFVWSLEEFLKCMSNQRPKSVVTDGDPGMAGALRIVLPEANHRLCVWHLHRNAKAYLHRAEYLDQFMKCMMSWVTEDEFERMWQELVQSDGVRNNTWLAQKYRSKRLWAQAYITGKFFGTLKTTSRCEGCNSYIKKFVNREGPMLEFLHSIDNAMKSMRELELGEDFQSRQAKPFITSELIEIEKDAGQIFTKRSFQRFMKELRREAAYFCRGSVSSEGTNHIREYTLTRYMNPGKETKVTYNEADETIKCQCGMFETEGLICRHQIHIMKVENLSKIPKSCTNKRWTIDAKQYLNDGDQISEVDNEGVSVLRKSSLMTMCQRLCDLGSRTREKVEETRSVIANLVQILEEGKSLPSFTPAEQGTGSGQQSAQTQTTREDNVEDSRKRSYRCSICKLTGHKKTTCPSQNQGKGVDNLAIGRRARASTRQSDSEFNTSDEELCVRGRAWAEMESEMEDQYAQGTALSLDQLDFQGSME